MKRRWLTDENGREFRTIPMNLDDRSRAVMPWTIWRLQREFRTLWEQGLIYKDEETGS